MHRQNCNSMAVFAVTVCSVFTTTGTYPVVLTYSPRFKCTLPLIQNVPHFEGIRIPPGNSATDTSGCILVGRRTAPGRLTDSRQTLRQLMKALTNRPRDQDIAIAIN